MVWSSSKKYIISNESFPNKVDCHYRFEWLGIARNVDVHIDIAKLRIECYWNAASFYEL